MKSGDNLSTRSLCSENEGAGPAVLVWDQTDRPGHQQNLQEPHHVHGSLRSQVSFFRFQTRQTNSPSVINLHQSQTFGLAFFSWRFRNPTRSQVSAGSGCYSVQNLKVFMCRLKTQTVVEAVSLRPRCELVPSVREVFRPCSGWNLIRSHSDVTDSLIDRRPVQESRSGKSGAAERFNI